MSDCACGSRAGQGPGGVVNCGVVGTACGSGFCCVSGVCAGQGPGANGVVDC